MNSHRPTRSATGSIVFYLPPIAVRSLCLGVFTAHLPPTGKITDSSFLERRSGMGPLPGPPTQVRDQLSSVCAASTLSRCCSTLRCGVLLAVALDIEFPLQHFPASLSDAILPSLMLLKASGDGAAFDRIEAL
jgi:hypothetical protein